MTTPRSGPPRIALLAAVCVGLAMNAALAFQPPAEAEQPEPAAAAQHETIPSDAADSHGEAEPPAKTIPHGDDMAAILVMLLGGVVMLAVAAFATILIWGRRMRRSIREAPSKTKLQDELWYLRAKAGLPPEKPQSPERTPRQD